MFAPVLLLGTALAGTMLASPDVALAQDDEVAGAARSEYAWGDGGGSRPDDPLRIMAFAGAGAGARLVRNLDPPFNQTFMSPAYLDLGGAVFFPGGDVRHGVGLFLSTNLTAGVSNSGLEAGEQWALTPSYFLDLPFRRLLGMDHDWLHLMGRFGLPVVLSSPIGGGDAPVDVSVGAELGVSLVFKFLAGLGIYVEAQLALYGGTNDTVHPILTGDAGFVFDYEVLP